MSRPAVDEVLAFRCRLIFGVLALIVLVFVARLYQWQVVEGPRYLSDARANSVKHRPVEAPRGRIQDREGRLLVGNRLSHDLVLKEKPEDEEAALLFVHRLTGRSLEDIEKSVARQRKKDRRVPPVVARDILFSQLAYFETRREDVPDLDLRSRTLRDYVQGSSAAHVLGYCGEISAEELARQGRGGLHRRGDLIGKRGIEKTADRFLTGQRGEQKVIVDTRGRIVETELAESPERGADLRLTLDLELQQRAEAALEGRRGACVVLDARTGAVRVLASSPTHDLEAFSGRISHVLWSQLNEDPDGPLRDRTISGGYPPGSVYKPLVAAVALEQGLSPERTSVCYGQTRVFGQTRRCWKKIGHGEVDMHAALVGSCNIYFYELGRDMGADPIFALSEKAGFGRRTGIDITGERAGLMPSRSWKRRTQGEGWYPGDTINLSIGQGFLSVSVLQVALNAMAIGNGGAYYRPYVLDRVLDHEGNTLHVTEPEVLGRLDISARTVSIIKTAMEDTVASGTGRRARLDGVSVAGKTGTAQSVGSATSEESNGDRRHAEHAWFMGYAPADQPELAFAVILEHSGQHGGEAAAPVAHAVLSHYFRDRLVLTGF
ncbi:MAG: penicillin-binding protein 2 [Acidobacteriota bacterium]